MPPPRNQKQRNKKRAGSSAAGAGGKGGGVATSTEQPKEKKSTADLLIDLFADCRVTGPDKVEGLGDVMLLSFPRDLIESASVKDDSAGGHGSSSRKSFGLLLSRANEKQASEDDLKKIGVLVQASELLHAMVDTFYDEAEHIDEFIQGIEKVKRLATDGDGLDWDGGLIPEFDLLRLVAHKKMFSPRGKQVVVRSLKVGTIKQFKRELRREFLEDMKRLAVARRKKDDKSGHGWSDKDFIQHLPGRIRRDANLVGTVDVRWKQVVQQLLPADLRNKIHSDEPFALADELETLQKQQPASGSKTKVDDTSEDDHHDDDDDDSDDYDDDLDDWDRYDTKRQGPEEIMLQLISIAESWIEDFHDRASEVEEIIDSIECAADAAEIGDEDSDDSELGYLSDEQPWHNGFVDEQDLLTFVRHHKLLGVRGQAAIDKSKTIKEFATNLRTEFANDLKTIQRIKQAIEDGHRYKHLVPDDLDGLPRAIEADAFTLGSVRVQDGWKAALTKVLPNNLGRQITKVSPFDIAAELRVLLKTYNPDQQAGTSSGGSGKKKRSKASKAKKGASKADTGAPQQPAASSSQIATLPASAAGEASTSSVKRD